MLHTRNLSKVFRHGDSFTQALINVNVDIGKGEFVSVVGPSGCGKTTLMGIMGLLEAPDNGEVFFLGQEVGSLSDKERLMIRRGKIGYLFSDFELIEDLSVANNIEIPLIYNGLSRKERKLRIEEVIARYRLNHLRRERVSELPGLQQQIVSLARSVSYRPSVLLADEPTSRLNSIGSSEIFDMLSQVNEDGMTVVLFTNSTQDAQRAQRVVQLFDGHVVNVTSQH